MPFEKFIDAIINIEVQERHYTPQSKLLPTGIYVHKMEGDLFLKMLKPLNVSEKLNLWTEGTKEKVYQFYKEDFIRFNYYYHNE